MRNLLRAISRLDRRKKIVVVVLVVVVVITWLAFCLVLTTFLPGSPL
jgi:hypothetical protein